MRSQSRRQARNLALLLGLCAFMVPTARATVRVNLNGFWRMKIDPSGIGQSAGWTKREPAGTVTIRVPGTWSVLRSDFYYVGAAWYFRTFTFPAPPNNERIELHFGATFYKSHVWLNGKFIGGHEGGYTAYDFNITPYLKPVNYLAVEIEDRPGFATIPGWAMRDSPRPGTWYDWWPDGGIVRSVWLKVSAPQEVSWQQILTAESGRHAIVTDHIHIENHSTQAVSAVLRVEATSPDGGTAAKSNLELSLKPGSDVQTVTFQIHQARLWSFDNPNLYRMKATLLSPRGQALDSLSNHFGIRTFKILNRRLYLNGHAVRLTGIDRHEDSPWEGLAETEGTIRYDFDNLKKLQVTLTRPVHYPQNPRIYQFCDRHGILLIPEIPLWHFSAAQFADPRVIALAKQMMREVIEQDGNHPSIFAWSVCNESATNTPQGVAYFKTMDRYIKSLDPSRYVTYADDLLPLIKDPSKNAASYADFVMWNEYYGSGHGPSSVLPSLIQKIGRDYPNKMVIISETAPWMPLTRNPRRAVQYSKQSIGKELALFGKYPWIAGVLYWCYAPYRSHAFPRRSRLTVPIPTARNPWKNFGFTYVNRNRQREPIYRTFQKDNSPANIEMRLIWPAGDDTTVPPAGFKATIARHGPDHIPSYALDHYQAVWQAVDLSGKELGAGVQKLPIIGPPDTFVAHWVTPAKTTGVTLRLWLYRPTGFLAAHATCWWRPPIWRLGLWRCSGSK